MDRSQASRSFIVSLGATEQLRIIGVTTGLFNISDTMDKGPAQAAIVIPRGFERDLLLRRQPVLRVYVNTTRFMIAVDAGKGLSEAIMQTDRDILVQTFLESGLTRENARRLAQPMLPRSENLGNTLECYGDFIIPALLLLILQQSLFVGTAAATAGRYGGRGRGISPGSGIIARTTGRALPYFLLYGFYGSLFFTLQYRIWGIPFNGGAAVIAVLTAIHLATIIIAGFLLGSLCASRLTAFLIGMFTSYPAFLLSGLAWPSASMPRFLRTLSLAFPSTHYFPAALAAARMHAGWTDVADPCVMLALLFTFFLSCLLIANAHALRQNRSFA